MRNVAEVRTIFISRDASSGKSTPNLKRKARFETDQALALERGMSLCQENSSKILKSENFVANLIEYVTLRMRSMRFIVLFR